MRWWPWGGAELRQSQGFSDLLTNALIDSAEGTVGTAARTAALESCAAMYGMCFAAATVEDAPPMVADAITPASRALIGRNLVRRGEDVHLIAMERDGLRLLPAGSWDIRGGADPADWYARIDVYGPSATYTTTVPHAAIVHSRYAVDSAFPWRGVPPLSWAKTTDALIGRIEEGLSKEARAKPAILLPTPKGPRDPDDENDPANKLGKDIAAADGRPVMVETTAGGWGAGKGAAPLQDWAPKRLGAAWPEALRATRRDVYEDVAGACGVPAVLLDPRSEGTSQREALRRFAHTALEPLGRIVAAELAEKLDAPNLRLNFEAIRAGDLAGRARAVGILVKAGWSKKQAAMIAGLEA